MNLSSTRFPVVSLIEEAGMLPRDGIEILDQACSANRPWVRRADLRHLAEKRGAEQVRHLKKCVKMDVAATGVPQCFMVRFVLVGNVARG